MSTNNMNGARTSSRSPTDNKPNGGVALPRTNGHVNGGSSQSNGNAQDKNGSPTDPRLLGHFNALKRDHSLNGGASAFKPDVPKVAVPKVAVPKVTPSPLFVLNRSSTADDGPVIVSSSKPAAEKSPDKKTQDPVGTKGAFAVESGGHQLFTTDFGPMIEFQGGHYLKIDNITKADLANNWDNIMSDLGLEEMLVGLKAMPSSDGTRFTYFCCFDDVRQTDQAFQYFEMAQTGWQITYINQWEYAKIPNGQKSPKKSYMYDGQVVFSATFCGTTHHFKPEQAAHVVEECANSFGDVRVFMQETSATWPSLEWRVEYYQITDTWKALEAATAKSPYENENFKVVASEKQEFADVTNNMAAAMNGLSGIRIVSTPPRDGEPAGAQEFVSPTGRTCWRTNENGKQEPGKPMRVVPKVGAVPYGVPILQHTPSRDRIWSEPSPHTPSNLMDGVNMGPRSGSWNGYSYSYASHPSPRREPTSGPQCVELWKIQNGQDVRTTVMLRNIPNRMSCYDLRNVLNQTSKGRFDFSYLRIDFEKGTNVGYAFVNFADPMDIIPFVEFWHGKRWQSNNPRRVELSYATVQGYDCLVEKFRNSAIMSEFGDYRPKLWYTTYTAPAEHMVGEEAPFPGPNNMSKKQRSLDNAGQIGLYAPRTGHVSRERGRRSQFDRGTPAQLREDAAYYQHTSPVQNGHYSYGNNGYANNGYANNGYANNGYGMTPRMAMGPPPPFPPMMYGNGYNVNPYMNGNGFMAPQTYGYGHFENADPFGPGSYNSGYGNGYDQDIRTSPGTPASRLRTQTNGKLGGHPKKVSTVGGPVQSPDGGYGGPMPQVVEDDETGYNNTLGPQYMPRY